MGDHAHPLVVDTKNLMDHSDEDVYSSRWYFRIRGGGKAPRDSQQDVAVGLVVGDAVLPVGLSWIRENLLDKRFWVEFLEAQGDTAVRSEDWTEEDKPPKAVFCPFPSLIGPDGRFTRLTRRVTNLHKASAPPYILWHFQPRIILLLTLTSLCRIVSRRVQ